jgi:hypothetical protein
MYMKCATTHMRELVFAEHTSYRAFVRQNAWPNSTSHAASKCAPQCNTLHRSVALLHCLLLLYYCCCCLLLLPAAAACCCCCCCCCQLLHCIYRTSFPSPCLTVESNFAALLPHLITPLTPPNNRSVAYYSIITHRASASIHNSSSIESQILIQADSAVLVLISDLFDAHCILIAF